MSESLQQVLYKCQAFIARRDTEGRCSGEGPEAVQVCQHSMFPAHLLGASLTLTTQRIQFNSQVTSLARRRSERQCVNVTLTPDHRSRSQRMERRPLPFCNSFPLDNQRCNALVCLSSESSSSSSAPVPCQSLDKFRCALYLAFYLPVYLSRGTREVHECRKSSLIPSAIPSYPSDQQRSGCVCPSAW